MERKSGLLSNLPKQEESGKHTTQVAKFSKMVRLAPKPTTALECAMAEMLPAVPGRL
ncbi:MAG: hypothetical protein LBF42_01335 [Puniceicoccales bacterium]|nr:hypothetical protein [Puniceicoccales bacterium]